jgi:hypothetical protein
LAITSTRKQTFNITPENGDSNAFSSPVKLVRDSEPNLPEIENICFSHGTLLTIASYTISRGRCVKPISERTPERVKPLEFRATAKSFTNALFKTNPKKK